MRYFVLLVLAGCAHAPPPAAAPEMPPPDDGAMVQALQQEQSRLDLNLHHPGGTQSCSKTCVLSGSICEDSAKICALARRNAASPTITDACSDAADTCTQDDLETRSRGCTCAR